MNGDKRVFVVILVIMALALLINALALFWTQRNQTRIIAQAFHDLTR